MAMKKSVGVGRLPSRVEVEKQIVAWVNDLPSDEIWARVTASMIKHKAVELHPMFFGPIVPPRRTTCWRCLTSVTMTTRAWSKRATTMMLKKWNRVWNREQGMGPTRRLVGELAGGGGEPPAVDVTCRCCCV